MLKKILFFLFTVTSVIGFSQKQDVNSVAIYHKIKKLNFLGKALFIAAHPDDENTRIISYLSNNVYASTAYLSLTRGDGGQNLIGTEQKELLGLLRTQELLQARKIDGGTQFFTRAIDFGYSKHPDETFSIWDKDAVLEDILYVIRTFRPDVIINRFNHRTPGTTHGHHTASAILGLEAFEKSAKKFSNSKLLTGLSIWQPKRLFFNTSWWFYGSREKFNKADKSNFVELDTGVFYPEMGLSNTEIAANSRSQHKCQGFGSALSRGTAIEYLEFIDGEKTKSKTNVFDGIETTWKRIRGGDKIFSILNTVETNFNFKNPEKHISDLLKAYELIQNIEDNHWRITKTKKIKEIIKASLGLYVSANTKEKYATPNSSLQINLEIVNRSQQKIKLVALASNYIDNLNVNKILDYNTPYKKSISANIPIKQDYTTPYWLIQKSTTGMYNVQNKFVGKPETPKPTTVIFSFEIDDVRIELEEEIVHKHTDRVKGEVIHPFTIIPQATVSIIKNVLFFKDNKPEPIKVNVKSYTKNFSGKLTLNVPKGWTFSPKEILVSINDKEAIKTFNFVVNPSKINRLGTINPIIMYNNKKHSLNLKEVDYNHIPRQLAVLPSRSKVVNLTVKSKVKKVGYIHGAGDKIPENLEEVGIKVELIDLNLLTAEKLKNFKVIILGIRAFNVLDQLMFKNKLLLDFVKQGGTLVNQYNTVSWRNPISFDSYFPYPIKLSRDRVADENSKVTLIAPKHPVLNTPNKITEKDFEYWVQERGLYFPNQWDAKYTAILSMNDKEETPKKGSLLIAKYGRGYYVYTGLSFFRELPEGVPGAYKLFLNIISLNQ